MPDRHQENYIRLVPFFRNLPPDQFQRVVQAFQVRRYNVEELIFQMGNHTRGLHIIVDGQATLYDQDAAGNWRTRGTLTQGNFVNQEALFRDGYETGTLQVVQPVTALYLSRDAMANLLAYNPDIAQSLGLDGSKSHHKNKVVFKGQRENELVILVTRTHWWAYSRWMALPVLLMLGFWAIAAFAPVLTWLWMLLSVLIPGAAAVYLYIEWMNDSVIITDQRVIRITHTILTFSESRDEVAIQSVQEANAEIPPMNVFAKIFNFGTIEIKTAGSQGNFILDHIPNPQRIQDIILEDVRQLQTNRQVREQQAIRADIERWIGGDAPARNNLAAKNNAKVWEPAQGPLSPFRLSYPIKDGGIVHRTHWFMWIRVVFMPSMWLLATFIYLLLALLVPEIRDLGIIAAAIGFVMLLIGVVWLYTADWDWRNDYYIVTDRSITFINQRPLWLKSEKDQVLLEQVDNVKSETSGIWQRMFNYGDVSLSLLGADEFKVFKNVHQPLKIQEDISRRQGRLKQQATLTAEQQQRELMGDYLTAYHQTLTGQQIQPTQPYPPQVATLRDKRQPPLMPQPQQPSISPPRPYDGQYQNPAPPPRPSYPQQPQQNPYPYYEPDDRPQYPPNLPQQGDRPAKFPRKRPPQ